MTTKIIIFISIPLGAIVIIAALLRLTGTVNYYHSVTPSMEPTIKVGDYVVSSKYSLLHDQDIVCYKVSLENGKQETWVKRLVGLPGEKLKIKRGLVFINEKLSDDSAKLYRPYIISKLVYNHYNNIFRDNPEPFPFGTDSLMVTLASSNLKLFKQEEQPRLYQANANSPDPIFTHYILKGWTIDNMGPVTIPKDSCFLLGDNRHNSVDSRYTGFVALKDISGVVLNKK